MSPSDGGGHQGGRLRDQGRRRLLGLQVRGRHPSRPARARHRVAGPHPHLDRDGRRDARGRGRRRRDRREGPQDRRLPLVGPGRPVGEHDRLGRADHAPADRASSSRCRTSARSSRTGDKAMRVLRARLYEAERERQQAEQAAARKAQVGTRRARREDPHLQLPAGPRHRSPRRGQRAARRTCSPATSTSFTDALTADAQRRALEGGAGDARRGADAPPPTTSRARASTRRGSTPS